MGKTIYLLFEIKPFDEGDCVLAVSLYKSTIKERLQKRKNKYLKNNDNVTINENEEEIYIEFNDGDWVRLRIERHVLV